MKTKNRKKIEKGLRKKLTVSIGTAFELWLPLGRVRFHRKYKPAAAFSQKKKKMETSWWHAMEGGSDIDAGTRIERFSWVRLLVPLFPPENVKDG